LRLIRERVIPLFLAYGNIAALTKALNDALSVATVEGTLHPNRLHTLLSDDVSRGINEATLQLTETAAELAFEHDAAVQERATAALETLQLEATRLHLFAGAAADELARRLNIPPAVAGQLVTGSSVSPSSARSPSASSHIGSASGHRLLAPDWTFQDTAVARCLEAFGRRRNGRIGLILPTGAGKTRTAMRIVLAMLAKSAAPNTLVYWVTHQRNLREQAHRELQKLVGCGCEQIPDDQLMPLANRIKFVMVGELAPLLKAANTPPVLIVVDEAHHAAAPSYEPVFSDLGAAPVLLLTATPNRSDRLPIGIDEIAFTITYRELAERRAVLTPQFIDFPVSDFDWSQEAIADLADYVIESATAEFTKVLVLAPRLDRVEEFYQALANRLPQDHPLAQDDLGYVHGSGNSLDIDNEDFLALFAAKPRAVLVSAQLLLEGFDDPAINTVVVTYPSTSVIRLMQAAGRCVRYAPSKRTAYVVQARNDHIAYHFDQRWLYQEIDDFLRPQLLDVEYGSVAELKDRATALLQAHNVEAGVAKRMLKRLDAIAAGETCRFFLYGLPYFGRTEAFETDARWGVTLETPETSVMLRSLFNGFCALGADLSDPSDFLLRNGAPFAVGKDLAAGSRWMELTGLLTASYFAKREVHGPTPLEVPGSRPYRSSGASTWLKYLTFTFRPAIAPKLADFLRDCHNARRIEALYLERPARHAAAVKVPLPLGGAEAFLLDAAAHNELDAAVSLLRSRLAESEPQDHLGVLAAFIASSNYVGLPARLLLRVEFLLSPTDRGIRVLLLNDYSHLEQKEDDHDQPTQSD
jgi:superfamily II DNA or RNA helicase